MFILVEHTISDPAAFWAEAQAGIPNLPANLKLHHCFPTPSGERAVCVWEGESVAAVEDFLGGGGFNRASKNEFYPVENQQGIALPSGVLTA